MIYNKEYSEIDGVKIYIKNIESYIAESYLLLATHNKYNEFRLHTYINQQARKEYFEILINAYLHNYNNIRELLEKVKPYVEIDDVLNVNTSKDNVVNATLKDYIYLQRDWCYYEGGEFQIEKTVKSIQNVLPIEMGNALFLGCGVGRLAIEFSDIFSKVLATDKSYSMMWHVNQLMSGSDFEFYTPQEKNIYSLENVARKHTASMSDTLKAKVQDKVDFFVSDVLDLPLEENSMDAVFSIYFTDVIALKLWFEKINSVIREDGYFIHFGPLDYFFSAESEMLTAKEFKVFFEENGYETIADEIVETSHLNDPDSLVYKIYRNWMFVAKKKKI